MNTAGWSKAVGLGLVGLVLTMVLGRIAWLVQERQERQQAAQQEVAESTASSQLLRGPYLERLCTEEWTVTETTVDDRGQRESRRREARQARLRSTPAALQINGDLKPQQLERGLFKVSTYQAQLQLNARWDTLQEVQLSSAKPEAEVRCDAIRLVMEVSDARGLRSVALQLNEQVLTTRPGTPSGGCAACSTSRNLPLEGVPGWYRAVFGTAFTFIASTGAWSWQTSQLDCAVDLATCVP